MTRTGFDEGLRVLPLCNRLLLGYQWPPRWLAGCKPSVTLEGFGISVDQEWVGRRWIDHRKIIFSVHRLDQVMLTTVSLASGQLFVWEIWALCSICFPGQCHGGIFPWWCHLRDSPLMAHTVLPLIRLCEFLDFCHSGAYKHFKATGGW